MALRLTEDFALGAAVVPVTAGGGDDRGSEPEGMVVFEFTTPRHAVPNCMPSQDWTTAIVSIPTSTPLPARFLRMEKSQRRHCMRSPVRNTPPHLHITLTDYRPLITIRP